MPTLSTARHILVVRTDRMGDFILTSAFLRELRNNAPAARISLVVRPDNLSLVQHCPHVNQVLAFEDNLGPRVTRLRIVLRAYRFAHRHLRNPAVDLVVLPRWDTDLYYATYVAYLSGAARRTGYASHSRYGDEILLNDVIDRPAVAHEVRRTLVLLEHLGARIKDERLELWLPPQDNVRDTAGTRPRIAIAPGAADAKRRWPAERFTKLCRWLVEERDTVPVLFGGPADRGLADRIESSTCGIENRAGTTEPVEAARHMGTCSLYIGGDTGLMHMAVAAGMPVVMISCHPLSGPANRPNSPQRFGPWCVEHRILQPREPLPPCMGSCVAGAAHCIQQITLDQVRAATLELFNTTSTKHRLEKI
jgi:heptosyltransferase-2